MKDRGIMEHIYYEIALYVDVVTDLKKKAFNNKMLPKAKD